MISVCRPGRAMSKDSIKLPILAFENTVLRSGTLALLCAFVLAIENSKIGFLKIGGQCRHLLQRIGLHIPKDR